jgi:bacteriocin-like protein
MFPSSVKNISHATRRLIMKTKEETTEKQEKERAVKELNEKELETVAGGVSRRTTGPGTQTEDDVYVG